MMDEHKPELLRVVPEHDQNRQRRIRDGLVRLAKLERSDLIEGGALLNAVADFVVLAQNHENIMEDLFTSSVRDAERVLKSVVLSDVHLKRYAFVVDNPPIEEDHDLLCAAFELDGELYQDETFSIQELVTVTRIDLDVARRILCRWIDDAVAYVPITKLDPNVDRETIFLLEKASASFGR